MRLMFIPLVHMHTHPYGIGRCVGRVCKEGVWCRAVVFTCNPERPPETLREAAGPPGKVRLVGRGSESSTPPAPLNQNVSSFICYGNQGLLKISFGKRILLKMRCGNH